VLRNSAISFVSFCPSSRLPSFSNRRSNLSRPTSRLIIHKCCVPVNLCGYLWIFVDHDIEGDICGQLEDTRGSCGSLWIFVDLCGYSIQSYLHAGRPLSVSQSCSSTAPVQNSPCVEMATGRMRGARDRRPEISCRSTMASRRAYLSSFLVCASNTAFFAAFRSLVRRSSFRSLE